MLERPLLYGQWGGLSTQVSLCHDVLVQYGPVPMLGCSDLYHLLLLSFRPQCEDFSELPLLECRRSCEQPIPRMVESNVSASSNPSYVHVASPPELGYLPRVGPWQRVAHSDRISSRSKAESLNIPPPQSDVKVSDCAYYTRISQHPGHVTWTDRPHRRYGIHGQGHPHHPMDEEDAIEFGHAMSHSQQWLPSATVSMAAPGRHGYYERPAPVQRVHHGQPRLEQPGEFDSRTNRVVKRYAMQSGT